MTRRFDYACKSKQKQRNIFIYTSKYANVYFVDKFQDENLADSTTQPTEIIELGVLHIRIWFTRKINGTQKALQIYLSSF